MTRTFSDGLGEMDLDDIKKPTNLPAGDAYEGVITAYKFRSNPNTNERIWGYTIKPTSWSPEVDEGDKIDGMGKSMDLSSKLVNMDYFVDDERGRDAMATFLRAAGKSGNVEKAFADAVGTQVKFKLAVNTSKKDGQEYANVRKISPL